MLYCRSTQVLALILAVDCALGAVSFTGSLLGDAQRNMQRRVSTAFLPLPTLRIKGLPVNKSNLVARKNLSLRGRGTNTRMMGGETRGGDENPAHLDPKFEGWVERSWAKAQQLERAFAMQIDAFTADSAVIRNRKGEQVDTNKLRGKSVALYFSSGWCPDCISFTPILKQYYEAQKDKIEIVHVSSDFSEADAQACYQQKHGDWLMLDYNSPMRDEYKLRYGVWAGKETAKLATSIAAFKGRKSGIPALVVLNLEGDPIDLLNAEGKGMECLLQWQPEEQAWPIEPQGQKDAPGCGS